MSVSAACGDDDQWWWKVVIHYTGGSQGASSYLVPGRSEQLCHCFLPLIEFTSFHLPIVQTMCKSLPVLRFAHPPLPGPTNALLDTNLCTGWLSLILQGLTDRHRSLTDCTGRVGAITSTIPFYSHQALKLSSALWSKSLFGLRNIFSRKSLE